MFFDEMIENGWMVDSRISIEDIIKLEEKLNKIFTKKTKEEDVIK